MFASPSARYPFALRAALAVVFLLAAAVQFPFALNHDAAWHFYTATRVLAGERIGLDIADINPPMAMWLFSLPGLLVAQFSAPPAPVFRAFVLLIAALSLFLCRRPLNLLLGPKADVALLAIAAAFLLFPAYDFGQREHLAALLVLPYACLAALRAEGRSLSMPVLLLMGLLAGIGVCFKPYFLAVPALVELWLLLQLRHWRSPMRAEVFAMVGVGMAYLVGVALFAPDYLTRVVPEAMRTYAGFERPFGIVLAEAGMALLGPLIAFLLALIATPRLHRLSGALLAAGCGFLIAALLQQKGWTYQVMPAALYGVAAAAVQGALADRFRLLVAAAIAAVCLMPVLINLRDQLSPSGTSARVAQLETVFREPGVNSVYAFITSPRDMHPAVLSARKHWADAYGVMMFLPAHMAALDAPAGEPAREAIDISETYLRAMLDRFAATPPDILAFDAAAAKLGLPHGRDFDYIEFLNAYPTFRMLIARYDEIEPVGRFRLFRLR